MERRRRVAEGRLDFPGKELYEGEEAIERERRAPAEDAEAVELPHPDELADTLAERLETVDTADRETVKRWFEEARDGWPEPLRSRLMDACRAQAERFAS